MRLNDEIAVLLYQAAASAVGIVVHVSNPLLFQTRAGHVKSKLQDPALANLNFRRSPDPEHFDDEIWIVKSGVRPKAAFEEKINLDRMIEEITKEVTGEDDSEST